MLINSAIKENNRIKTHYLVYIFLERIDKLTKFEVPILSDEDSYDISKNNRGF